MASMGTVVKNLVRPRAAAMSANRFINELRTGSEFNEDGTDIMAEDWDTLVILDACRYDTFKQRHDLPGELDSRVSRGGGTVEFLRGNFADRTFDDTVYVTGNPQITRFRDELGVEFHDIWHVWQEDWDEEIQNVHPEDLTAAGLAAHEQYPNKRIILHYNQPHGPYIGPTSDDLVIGPNRPQDSGLVSMALYERKHARISRETWAQAYEETFEFVHPYIEEVLSEIDGKTVVAADHGEMLGERATPIPVRYCGHQMGVHTEALVKVPWLVHETGSRRAIESGDSRGVTTAEDGVEDRLRDLGYV